MCALRAAVGVREERRCLVFACAHAHSWRSFCARHPSDNLAANFSRELADFIIYVIDVAGGDKIPRKGGPGITQADLLVRGEMSAVADADVVHALRVLLRSRAALFTHAPPSCR